MALTPLSFHALISMGASYWLNPSEARGRGVFGEKIHRCQLGGSEKWMRESESGVPKGKYIKYLLFKRFLISSHSKNSLISESFGLPFAYFSNFIAWFSCHWHSKCHSYKVLLDLWIYCTVLYFALTLYLFLFFVKSSLSTLPLILSGKFLHFLQISNSFEKLLYVSKALCKVVGVYY